MSFEASLSYSDTAPPKANKVTMKGVNLSNYNKL